MRFDFEGDEFPGAFVEFSDAWTLKDKRRIFEAQGEEFYALLRGKVAALHLPALDGADVTAPDQLTLEGVEGLDGRLWDWFRGTIGAAIVELGQLGESMRRRLFTSGKSAES